MTDIVPNIFQVYLDESDVNILTYIAMCPLGAI